MGYMTATRSASTANVAYRGLQQWFKWMIAEDEIEHSPMERTTPPFVPEKAVPVLSIDQMRALPFGDKTGAALARYLRARARERHAGRPELWLAEKNRGPLLAGGINQMLKRRGKAMNSPIPGLHAHMFRHTAAHRWMAEGASETDVMRIMGWRSHKCSAATARQPLTSARGPRTSA